MSTARLARIADQIQRELAELIRLESGLCVRETTYEVGRAQDVLMFASMEALRDDGQIAVFSNRADAPRGEGA